MSTRWLICTSRLSCWVVSATLSISIVMTTNLLIENFGRFKIINKITLWIVIKSKDISENSSFLQFPQTAKEATQSPNQSTTQQTSWNSQWTKRRSPSGTRKRLLSSQSWVMDTRVRLSQLTPKLGAGSASSGSKMDPISRATSKTTSSSKEIWSSLSTRSRSGLSRGAMT